MQNKKLAVIFPGIGYHKDKPLLYYAAKLAQEQGFEIQHISYQDMPQKIRGDAKMMQSAAELAYQQASAQLQSAGIAAYSRILLIGKSIGTVAAAQYAAVHSLPAEQIWYTPLRAAFQYAGAAAACTAFLGENDPWSDKAEMKQQAVAFGIPLYLYPGCNHSLECADVLHNLEILQNVMQITADLMRASRR